jgi:hypothetical protein
MYENMHALTKLPEDNHHTLSTYVMSCMYVSVYVSMCVSMHACMFFHPWRPREHRNRAGMLGVVGKNHFKSSVIYLDNFD